MAPVSFAVQQQSTWLEAILTLDQNRPWPDPGVYPAE